MHVIATAGHVDHGKSTLVQALTGSNPDRLAEEQRRGLTIELGYCWTTFPGAGEVAFVDVPGHERFVTTMLAGIGPVPAVLFVVAADDPWMPQAAEHLAALDALGVAHGVLAVTRSDLADPAPALERAHHELGRTSLRGAPAVAVSGRTGHGLGDLRHLLAQLVRTLPTPPASSDVRLWADRCFHVRGAGMVVTGTLPAGTIQVGDSLALDSGALLRVRALQSLGRPVDTASGVARVALNVTGSAVDELARGSVLVTPGRWLFTERVDVRLGGPTPDRLPRHPALHIGAAHQEVHVRPLAQGLARLRLERPVPLRIGDRALLRDPGSRRVWGATILDPAPPRLTRRGAAAARAAQLADREGSADLEREVTARGLARRSLLERIGVPVAPGPLKSNAVVAVGDWLLSLPRATELREQVRTLVVERARHTPLDPGMPVGAVARALRLPDPELVTALVTPPLKLKDGRLTLGGDGRLPQPVEQALARLRQDLAEAPFAAPTADRLGELGLDPNSLAAAAKAGRVLRIGDGVVLLAGADRLALTWLAELPQPFTVSEARRRLGSSRRVVLPLLAHLDRAGMTRRLEDDRRSVRG